MPSGRNFSTLVEKIIKKVEPKEVISRTSCDVELFNYKFIQFMPIS